MVWKGGAFHTQKLGDGGRFEPDSLIMFRNVRVPLLG